ncbi:MAG: inositol monophosphatase family protein [Gemmatimonadales bacterium]
MKDSLELLALAKRAAERAGDYIRRSGGQTVRRSVGPSAERRVPSHRPTAWESKGFHDWVTDVDREAERLIAEVLRQGTPGARLWAEETSPDPVEDGLAWIVDPLDGTTNFLHGYPQYAISIAAARDGVLEAGVVLDITRDWCYGAVRGGGAFCGNTRLAVSEERRPERALIGTGFPFKHLDLLEPYLAQFRRLTPATSGIRRAGSAALDLADVAAGRLDGFWELRLSPWDIAAGVLLIGEAGGQVTDLGGASVGTGANGVVAGNPAIHAWLLAELANCE